MACAPKLCVDVSHDVRVDLSLLLGPVIRESLSLAASVLPYTYNGLCAGKVPPVDSEEQLSTILPTKKRTSSQE